MNLRGVRDYPPPILVRRVFHVVMRITPKFIRDLGHDGHVGHSRPPYLLNADDRRIVGNPGFPRWHRSMLSSYTCKRRATFAYTDMG